jgi:hypothetical protein
LYFVHLGVVAYRQRKLSGVFVRFQRRYLLDNGIVFVWFMRLGAMASRMFLMVAA